MTAIGEARYRRLLKRSRPFDEADLRGLSPMLILSPHQDDEALGCGGLIATAAALGLRPRVAYLTDGGASHRGSPLWPRERLSALRKAEATAALNDLGVSTEDVLFLDWPDAAPYPTGSIERANTLATLRRWTAVAPPASVWSPWPGEAHCDHLATAEVAAAFRDASRPRPAGFSFVVWGWNEPALDAASGVRSLACAATIEARTRALARHASQTTRMIEAPFAFTLAPEVMAITDRAAEIYLEAP